eukprot:3119126-Rhodomonas_salina.1
MEGEVEAMDSENKGGRSSREEGSSESPTSSRFSGAERTLGTDVAVEISQRAQLAKSDVEEFRIASAGANREGHESAHNRSGKTDARPTGQVNGDVEEAQDPAQSHPETDGFAEPVNVQPVTSEGPNLSCVERLLRFVSKVASSGVDHGYGYVVLRPQTDGLEMRRARDPQLRRELKNLFPGLVRGPLRGRIIDEGLGTQPIRFADLPSEMGTYSTEVDEHGAVVSVYVDNEAEDPAACEVEIPGLERNAKIAFELSPGAEQVQR